MTSYGKVKVNTITFDNSGTATDVPVSTIAVDSDLALKADLSSPTFTGTINGGNLVLSGDLTVNGTTTTINTQTLDVEDHNITLGKVSTPTDTTANGGGITLKGSSDHTFNWINATDAWTSSEHIHLIDNKKLFVGGASGTTDGLDIFHDGNHSYLSNTTGSLFIKSSNQVYIQDDQGRKQITCIDGGAVELYHGGVDAVKLATTSTGCTVTGTLAATSFSGDGSALTGIASGDPVQQAQYTSSTTYTVPAGITTIRAYAVGAGGNGGYADPSTYHQTSGAGGGMAYGDFAVTPGQTVTITISNRIATVSYGGTTLLTGNPGAHAVDGGTSQAAGGTATKHSSVTNGGAYSGGNGGYLSASGTGVGGASAGSPLGNGARAVKGGGAGIGAAGGTWNSYGGGGAGSGSTGSGTDYVSGGAGPDCRGRDGARYALYTDPLLKNCVMPGIPGHVGYNNSPGHYYYSEAPTGVGGYIVQSVSPYTIWNAGTGGSFAGGGSNGINVPGSNDNFAGDGGILAGGGASGGNSAEYWPGHGGYGGGGGSGQTTSGQFGQRGLGGSACVWIFHT